MRLTRKAALAGLASLAMAGAALAAEAPRLNIMNVSLPDGSVARIHYAGDTPPRVTIAPLPVLSGLEGPAPYWHSPAWGFAWDEAPFAAFHRLAAEMNRRMAELMRLSLAADGTPRLNLASGGALPAGSYSYVSRTVSQGGCTRTVEMTRTAADADPKVVTRTSGDCAGAAEPEAPAAPDEPKAI